MSSGYRNVPQPNQGSRKAWTVLEHANNADDWSPDVLSACSAIKDPTCIINSPHPISWISVRISFNCCWISAINHLITKRCNRVPRRSRTPSILPLAPVPVNGYNAGMSKHIPISDQIRFAVRQSGISQRDYAAQAGVPLSLLARFLAGGSVTSHNLDRILSALPKNLRKSLQP